MKKVLLSLVVIAVSSITTFAQISGGLKAGLNLANQKFEADGVSVTPDSKIGFHIGGYLNVAFSDKLSLQPELLYNSVGSDFDGGEFKLDYLSLPVMVKYNVVPVFNLHAGPQLGFLLSADADGEDVKDYYKSIDLGFGIGAGVDLPMGLNFTARYVLGLSNVGEDELFDSSDVTVKNNSFQISVGYKLFGKE